MTGVDVKKSALKNSETMPFVAIWVDLEVIILNEVREMQVS